MKFRFTVLFTAFLFLFVNLSTASAQVDSIIGQFTNSPTESFAGGISGNGRLVVFESSGNLATENPRNADGNREIFIFDYAQRRIFQITDTKSLLTDRTKPATVDNVRVEIINVRPVISNNGRWIAFGSNATTSTPTVPNSTNPGSFDANAFTDASGSPPANTNPLTMDGNTEMWIYEVPPVVPVDLSAGVEIPVTNLSAGIFTRVTNTLPSRLPVPGSSTVFPVIANDNRDVSISDDGNFIAFVSNRDLAPCAGTASATCGNAFPDFDNPEIYAYVRNLNIISQVTATPRGTAAAPINNSNPTISGTIALSGNMRVAFSSNAENPIRGMTGGSNSDGNDEIYFSDLAANGEPTGTRRQITQTTPTAPGDIVNILNYGRRMSRDGRYIAFDSYADLESSGAPIQTSFALYVYDTTAATAPFRRIGPRSDADSAATGGDLAHYPGFTDNDANGTPSTLVLETRLNIKADGTIPATAADGLNPATERPAQIYSYPLTVPATATFTRLTRLPVPSLVLASVQPIPSDSRSRMVFNMARTEVGTGNFDLLSEGYYLLVPAASSESTTTTLNYFTGASRIPVSPSPVPTPTPGATPTPSPSPTPQTPAAVQGVSPGMLAIVTLTPAFSQPAAELTAVGSLQRSFTLPIELGGVTLSVNGAAAGLKMVSGNQITFVVPPGLTPRTEPYPIVINNNGVVIRSSMTVVIARPDVFTFNPVPGPNGRARAFNATNRVLTGEPFTVTTLRFRGGRRVPTVLRLYLTGVQGATAANFSIRIGSVTIPPTQILTSAILVEPGVYTVDFTLPATLDMAGDVPVVVSIISGNETFSARLDDTAPRIRIL